MRTTEKTRVSTSQSYVERVNLAIDHVLAHLDSPLRLTDVARAASLSPFHFHRVFQMIVGETLADFVKRQRLDKALFQMSQSRRMRVRSRALLSVSTRPCQPPQSHSDDGSTPWL